MKKADKGDREGKIRREWIGRASKKKRIIQPVFYRVCDACSRSRGESVLFDAFGVNRVLYFLLSLFSSIYFFSAPSCSFPFVSLFFLSLSLALVVFACVRPSRRVSSIRKSIWLPNEIFRPGECRSFFPCVLFCVFFRFFFFFFKLFHPLFGKFLSCFALTRRGFIGSRGLNCAGEEWNLLGSRSARLLLRVDSTSSLESFSTKCFVFFKHRRQ